MKEIRIAKNNSINVSYGTDLEMFFKAHLEQVTPGKMLLSSNGDNVIESIASELGWKITTLDVQSESLIDVKHDDMNTQKIHVRYLVSGVEDFICKTNCYDAFVFFNTDIPSQHKMSWFLNVLKTLKHGALVIFEYTCGLPDALLNDVEHSKNVVFSEDVILDIFQPLSYIKVWKERIPLSETSRNDEGGATVIRMLGIK